MILLAVGLVLLTLGAELLVRGASSLALRAGISALVVGLTVVAFGTSAPELAVSVQGALTGRADVAVGNVVGSNIFNVLFILGLSALVVPLVVAQKLVRIEVPLLIGVSAAVWVLGLDGRYGAIEGAVLVAGLVTWTLLLLRAARRDPEPVGPEEPVGLLPALGGVAFGLVLLVIGARAFVTGAVDLALWLGMSERVVGLTVVAAGTSLPEVATSVVAAVRGQRDIAVGNVIGSNLFNLLGVLGMAAIVAPGGLPVAAGTLAVDLPVMTAVAALCLPIFFSGARVDRWEGVLFLALYAGWLALVVAAAGAPDPMLATARAIALGVVLLVAAATTVHAVASRPGR